MPRLLLLAALLTASAASAQPRPDSLASGALAPGGDVRPPTDAGRSEETAAASPADLGSAPAVPDPSDVLALPQEGGVYVADGSVGVFLTTALLGAERGQGVGPGTSSAVGLSATGILGTHRAAGGLFATAGTLFAEGAGRASFGVGGWAETSPRGQALGPAAEARLRFLFGRVQAGIVPVGTRARWARVGLDVPVIVVPGLFIYVGVAGELRRFSDTGETLRSVSVSVTL